MCLYLLNDRAAISLEVVVIAGEVVVCRFDWDPWVSFLKIKITKNILEFNFKLW